MYGKHVLLGVLKRCLFVDRGCVKMDIKSGVETSLDTESKTLTIKVSGRFDFSLHNYFREAYEQVDSEVKIHIVDLGNTVYLDSSALGMLLLLRDFAGVEQSDIRIVKCSDDVRKILSISNFEQLFSIG